MRRFVAWKQRFRCDTSDEIVLQIWNSGKTTVLCTILREGKYLFYFTPTRPPPSRGRGIASLPVEDPPQACAGGIEREGDKMISALLLFIEP